MVYAWDFPDKSSNAKKLGFFLRHYYNLGRKEEQLLQLCTARTAWSDSAIRSALIRFGT